MSAALKDTNIQLLELTTQWFAAKRAEIAAIQARRDIDAKIVAIMPKKDEGTVSENVGFFKVSVTHGITRKVDSTALDIEWEKLPVVVQAAFRWSADVAAKQFKALSGADLDAAIAFVESKPASPSVKVEVIDGAVG